MNLDLLLDFGGDMKIVLITKLEFDFGKLIARNHNGLYSLM